MVLDLYESLAVQIKCPPELQYLLKSVITPDNVPLLLGFGSWAEPGEVAKKLELPHKDVAMVVWKLFREGFVIRWKTSVKTRSFYGVINTLLGEGRLGHLSDEDRSKLREYYLQTRLQIYDQYLAEGKLNTSSRVITIREAQEHHQHLHTRGFSSIVTADEAFGMLSRARALALVPCSCRLTFGNCEKPVNTCINLNESAEELLQRGLGQKITADEGQEILAIADREGLVHLAISSPGQSDYALCSCCSCCCHDLQALLKYGRSAWVARAGSLAWDSPDDCIHCLSCVARCVFGARRAVDDKMLYDPDLCYGCGLCVTSCPVGAIRMTNR